MNSNGLRLQTIVLLSLIVVFGLLLVIPSAEAGVYLARSDSGALMLTNTPKKQDSDKTYKLLAGEAAPSNIEIPDPKTLQRIVESASDKHHVPESLIYSVIEIESDGETRAISEAGAVGLMQLMPATATELGVANPLDPKQNIFGGTKYLSRLVDRFNGDLNRALAAYNAGPGAVEKYDGIPPYEETEGFVERVRRRFERFKSKGDMIYTYRDKDGILHVTNLR